MGIRIDWEIHCDTDECDNYIDSEDSRLYELRNRDPECVTQLEDPWEMTEPEKPIQLRDWYCPKCKRIRHVRETLLR